MSALVQAAGAVVVRRHGKRRQIAVIHRPRYDDWTLPKGKLTKRESLPACAVREVREETGLDVTLDVRLDDDTYRLPGGDRKVVHYWRATIVAEHRLKANDEVDKLRWIDAEGGLRKLSHAQDRRTVRQAIALPPTTAVAIARHGKAMARKRYQGDDDMLRPLVERGRLQSRDLVPLLKAYGIEDLRTSSGTRCVQTLEPASHRLHQPLTTYLAFTEEYGIPRPGIVRALMAAVARDAARNGRPVVVCGHRPVIPAMLAGVGVAERPMGTGDLVVAHLAADGVPVAVEHHAAVR